VATGEDRPNSPIVVSATVPGTGPDSQNGVVTFNPLMHLQRPALLLANGIVYVAFGSHGDRNTWYGWVMGWDPVSLMLLATFCTSPDTGASSIWQTGSGITADPNGNLYVETGNGPLDANTGGRDYGDSVVELTSLGVVHDWFSPFDQDSLNNMDIDLGSAGSIVLPTQSGAHPNLLIATGKPGFLYLLDRDNMGHFQAGSNSQIVQSVPVKPNNSDVTGGIFATPAYWNGHIYIAAVSDHLKAFDLSGGQLSAQPTSVSTTLYDYPGASPAVSSAGASGGIVWTLEGDGYTPSNPPVLHAYDATNVASELYNSAQAPNTRDQAGPAVKMTVPTIANGKVYVGTQTELTVYGLLP
jgi:hypothetical protein